MRYSNFPGRKREKRKGNGRKGKKGKKGREEGERKGREAKGQTRGGGGGVHNMLRVRVCATHMGGFLGPKFSKQGSPFRQISLNKGGLSRNWRKIAKNGWFSAKIHHESGYGASFGN